MKGSWHLGVLSGIDVRIYWTFSLVPVWVYISTLAAGTGTVAATVQIIFILSIFWVRIVARIWTRADGAAFRDSRSRHSPVANWWGCSIGTHAAKNFQHY